jgi:hypothetical protein
MDPTHFPPGGSGIVVLLVSNNGAAATNGTPITINMTVPPGLTVTGAEMAYTPGEDNFLPCSYSATSVTCVYAGEMPGDSTAALVSKVYVAAEGAGEADFMTAGKVSGGGATTVSSESVVSVAAESPEFGIEEPFGAGVFDAAGALDTQAGDHPNTGTAGFVLNSVSLGGESFEAVQQLKDVAVDLPPGFVAYPLSAPTCPEYLVAPPLNGSSCPPGSVIGSVAYKQHQALWLVSGKVAERPSQLPLFNVTPDRGYPAEFAFIADNQEALLHPSLVHMAGGYIARITAANITPAAEVGGVKLTFFGDPAVVDDTGAAPAPFFANPTDCAGRPLRTVINVDSWQNPAALPLGANGSVNVASANFADAQWQKAVSESPVPTGCNQLRFNPEVKIGPAPKSVAASSPVGLAVNLRVPQNGNPTGLATPPLKEAKVTLPKGFVINPSQANGLEACTNEEFAEDSTEPGPCPAASQIGTVTVHTPVLAKAISGEVFLGSPECDPCSDSDAQAGRLARLFIQVHSDEYGVTIKIPGNVSIDPSTGQLTATFRNLIQQPFDELEFQFESGPRAPLVTPEACGSYTSNVDLAPWSAPYTPDALLSPTLEVHEGCATKGFAPSFLAGTMSSQAATFSPFTLSFSRSDGDQAFSGLQVVTPPGLLGLLSSVPLCGEAAANAGSCPAASQIGHTTVVAGPGSEPVTVPEVGQPQAPVYLTTGYKGAPFGLSVVVPAIAGPFNLGTVVVRAAISVSPVTAQATITSDPLPRVLDGIPLQVKSVNVTVDRPGFMFNPTSCNQLAVNGVIASTQSASAAVSSRFQAAGCGGLSFKPNLTASVAAYSSKPNGASLDVRIASKGGPGSGEANIRGVKVDLPIQLPSRTSTLNKACLSAVFEENPARCPKESDVGTATLATLVLASPLSGPAYLVSHGGAKFPDLEIVLQGEGVVVVLDGHTDIKKGVTSSNFDTAPDAPFSSFELKLPTGKFSILTSYLPKKANFDFCGQKLSMPTMITAQNGAILKQTTKIGVTGCPGAKKAKKAAKKAKASHGAKKSQKAGR